MSKKSVRDAEVTRRESDPVIARHELRKQSH